MSDNRIIATTDNVSVGADIVRGNRTGKVVEHIQKQSYIVVKWEDKEENVSYRIPPARTMKNPIYLNQSN